MALVFLRCVIVVRCVPNCVFRGDSASTYLVPLVAAFASSPCIHMRFSDWRDTPSIPYIIPSTFPYLCALCMTGGIAATLW